MTMRRVDMDRLQELVRLHRMQPQRVHQRLSRVRYLPSDDGESLSPALAGDRQDQIPRDPAVSACNPA